MQYIYICDIKDGKLDQLVKSVGGTVIWESHHPAFVEDRATDDLLPDETLIDLGIMKDTADIAGLEKMLKENGYLKEEDSLTNGNEQPKITIEDTANDGMRAVKKYYSFNSVPEEIQFELVGLLHNMNAEQVQNNYIENPSDPGVVAKLDPAQYERAIDFLKANDPDRECYVVAGGQIIYDGDGKKFTKGGRTENVNKPTETNEHGYNFYDASNLSFEDCDVEVSEPNPVFSDYGRGRKKMYDEITVSSKAKHYNKILKEDLSNHVYIIDHRSDGSYGVSSKVHNLTVSAKTYDDALKVAKTMLAIEDRDDKAVLTRDRSGNKIYEFANGGALASRTMLIPGITAQQVAEEEVKKNKHARRLRGEEKAAYTIELIDVLTAKADAMYSGSAHFRDNVSVPGRAGQQYLRECMHRWAAAYINKKDMAKFEGGGSPNVILYLKGGIFYSPNEGENLSFDEAQANINTEEHRLFKSITDSIDEELDVKCINRNAVGDWEDGAENTIYSDVIDAKDYETLKYDAALKALIGNQKAVLIFAEEDRDFAIDAVYTLKLPIDVKSVRVKLDDIGILARTLLKSENDHTEVVLFDKNLEYLETIRKLANEYETEFKYTYGRGEIFGSHKSREEGSDIFRDFIEETEVGRADEARLSHRYNRSIFQKGLSDILSRRADTEIDKLSAGGLSNKNTSKEHGERFENTEADSDVYRGKAGRIFTDETETERNDSGGLSGGRDRPVHQRGVRDIHTGQPDPEINTLSKGGAIETDTPIIPEMIADSVAADAVEKSGKFNNFTEARVDAVNKLAAYLVNRANITYKGSEHFKKSIRASGNRGRDNMYMWMGHWAEAYIKAGWKAPRGEGEKFEDGGYTGSSKYKASNENVALNMEFLGKGIGSAIIKKDDGYYYHVDHVETKIPNQKRAEKAFLESKQIEKEVSDELNKKEFGGVSHAGEFNANSLPYAGGGKLDRDLPHTNLWLKGFGMDTNGNAVVKVSYPNDNAFSIQTNGVLPETHRLSKSVGISDLTEEELDAISKEVSGYIKEYGSKKQKEKLKIYNKFAKGGSANGDAHVNDAEWERFENISWPEVKAFFKEKKPEISVGKDLVLHNTKNSKVYRPEFLSADLGKNGYEVAVIYHLGQDTSEFGNITYNSKAQSFIYSFPTWGIYNREVKFDRGGFIGKTLSKQLENIIGMKVVSMHKLLHDWEIKKARETINGKKIIIEGSNYRELIVLTKEKFDHFIKGDVVFNSYNGAPRYRLRVPIHLQYDKMKHGGSVEDKVKEKLQDATALKYQIALYIPSTKEKSEEISHDEMRKRVIAGEKFLANLFGGFSAVEVQGGYSTTDKGVVKEDVTRITAFAAKENFEEKFNRLLAQIKAWCSEWSQESMGLEFENELYYIDADKKFADGGKTGELPNKIFLKGPDGAKHWFYKTEKDYETVEYLSGNKYKKSFDEVWDEVSKKIFEHGLPTTTFWIEVMPLGDGEKWQETKLVPDKFGEFIAGYSAYIDNKKKSYLPTSIVKERLENGEYRMADKKFADGGKLKETEESRVFYHNYAIATPEQRQYVAERYFGDKNKDLTKVGAHHHEQLSNALYEKIESDKKFADGGALKKNKSAIIDKEVYRGQGDVINEVYGGPSDDGMGTFYTDNKQMAEWFAGNSEYDPEKEKYVSLGKKGTVGKSKISMHNPYVIDKGNSEEDAVQEYFGEIERAGGMRQYRDALVGKGHDGIILKNNATNYYGDGRYDVYIVFDKKFADGGEVGDLQSKLDSYDNKYAPVISRYDHIEDEYRRLSRSKTTFKNDKSINRMSEIGRWLQDNRQTYLSIKNLLGYYIPSKLEVIKKYGNEEYVKTVEEMFRSVDRSGSIEELEKTLSIVEKDAGKKGKKFGGGGKIGENTVYSITLTKDPFAPGETIYRTKIFDKEELQKIFDENVKKLEVGDELEYQKEDDYQFYPAMLLVEMRKDGPFFLTERGHWRKYNTKFAEGGEVGEWQSSYLGISGLEKIKEYSKKYSKNLYLVTDDNYSKIGNFWLRDGKFAKAETWGNPMYDFEYNKASLRGKNDVIYKFRRVNTEDHYADGGEVSEYDKQAEDFLKETGTTFSSSYMKHDTHFEGEQETRDIYKITLKNARGKWSFNFGQSIAETGIHPTAYSALAAITKNDPGTFEDFCSEFGYPIYDYKEKRTAQKVYNGVVKEWENVRKLFTEEQIEKLQEIQ